MSDDLDAFARAAAQEWSTLRVDLGAFVAHLRELRARDDAPPALAELRGADLYLAFACCHGDDAAWRELNRLYLARIPEYVRGVDPSPAFGDEVRQRVAERLGSKLRGYGGRGQLGGWIRMTAIREAHSIVRSAHGGRRNVDVDRVSLRDNAQDPELAVLRRHSAEAFKRSLGEVLDGLPEDERTILRMHYLDGLTIEQVGHAFQVSRATAARLIAQARERIVLRIERSLRDRLGAEAPGAQSLLGVVDSQFDLSIARHFGVDDADDHDTGVD